MKNTSLIVILALFGLNTVEAQQQLQSSESDLKLSNDQPDVIEASDDANDTNPETKRVIQEGFQLMQTKDQVIQSHTKWLMDTMTTSVHPPELSVSYKKGRDVSVKLQSAFNGAGSQLSRAYQDLKLAHFDLSNTMTDVKLLADTNNHNLNKISRTLSLRTRLIGGSKLTAEKDVKCWKNIFKQQNQMVESQKEHEQSIVASLNKAVKNVSENKDLITRSITDWHNQIQVKADDRLAEFKSIAKKVTQKRCGASSYDEYLKKLMDGTMGQGSTKILGYRTPRPLCKYTSSDWSEQLDLYRQSQAYKKLADDMDSMVKSDYMAGFINDSQINKSLLDNPNMIESTSEILASIQKVQAIIENDPPTEMFGDQQFSNDNAKQLQDSNAMLQKFNQGAIETMQTSKDALTDHLIWG